MDRKDIIRANLSHLPQGRPFFLWNHSIERVTVRRPSDRKRTNGAEIPIIGIENLYRIGTSRIPVTLDEAVEQIAGGYNPTESDIPSHPIFPPSWVAMSTHFPWAYLMARGFKEEELRGRPTGHRGVVLLHASGTKDSDYIIQQYKIPPNHVVRKAIIGAGIVTDCYFNDEEGCYAYRVEEAIYFNQPYYCSGQQSIFWKASTLERVKAFNRAYLEMKERNYSIN